MTLRMRKKIEQHELESLAPYAVKAAQSKGRTFPVREHPLRTAFQRDRDRIIHSAAFRRLEYKTQVFIPHEKDHFRTRLTHTIEVAQIARTLARNLGLNEDLTEAIALVHDLGHTPFGHGGEGVLNDLLVESGGFNHNRQSLRIVDLLEQRYPDYPGLNLTYEVREGIARHETSVKIELPEFSANNQPSLEASLVDISDEIAYNAHDIDDGLSSGILKSEMLLKTSFWDKLNFNNNSKFLTLGPHQQRYALVRHLINLMVTDVLEETQRRIDSLEITDLQSVHSCPEKVCGYSDSTANIAADIKNFLLVNLYKHPHLKDMTKKAHVILETIFETLSHDPALMPQRFQEMLQTERPETVIADYIAGMTDRFAREMYQQITE
ncbi:MAG: deoxyguanosinetriphosphate triphosphohydrolase [candidate division Zixibacteria bacterium]|nr:deoxyguanosinetriphosphate triphosphohydrolase [candidate division Zixibacteria bacterium]